MIGRLSIDLRLENIWRCWWLFRRGKRSSRAIASFEYTLEKNLFLLWHDLSLGTYRHGPYQQFTVVDNKRRLISVAGIRDRVVHRLLYEYLAPIFDPTFIYDAWSCRLGKGVEGAIERAQQFFERSSKGYVWRSDILKFFENVDRSVLRELIWRRAVDDRARLILDEVLDVVLPKRRSGGGQLYKYSTDRYAYRKSDQSNFCQYLSQRIGSVRRAYVEAEIVPSLW